MKSILFIIILFIIIVALVYLSNGIDRCFNRIKKDTTPKANKNISQRNFTIIAKQAAQRIKRINYLHVDGALVNGKVDSMSKISEWNFTLDFGNINHLTGDYLKHSSNKDSDIPDIVAQHIQSAILAYPNIELDQTNYYAFCPNCGKRLSGKKGNFCALCGARFNANY